jgi:hypothetical protein
VKSAFHKLLIICCALYLSGAHWMVLQVTAWTGMIVARSQTAPVIEAVETTLDGQHPCRLCSAISSGQKEEKKQEQQAPALKKAQEVKFVELEGFELPTRVVSGVTHWPDFIGAALARREAPPTPPPVA